MEDEEDHLFLIERAGVCVCVCKRVSNKSSLNVFMQVSCHTYVSDLHRYALKHITICVCVLKYLYYTVYPLLYQLIVFSTAPRAVCSSRAPRGQKISVVSDSGCSSSTNHSLQNSAVPQGMPA